MFSVLLAHHQPVLVIFVYFLIFCFYASIYSLVKCITSCLALLHPYNKSHVISENNLYKVYLLYCVIAFFNSISNGLIIQQRYYYVVTLLNLFIFVHIYGNNFMMFLYVR